MLSPEPSDRGVTSKIQYNVLSTVLHVLSTCILLHWRTPAYTSSIAGSARAAATTRGSTSLKTLTDG